MKAISVRTPFWVGRSGQLAAMRSTSAKASPARSAYPRMSSPFRRPFPTADGWISVVVYNDQGTVDVLFDVVGWYTG